MIVDPRRRDARYCSSRARDAREFAGLIRDPGGDPGPISPVTGNELAQEPPATGPGQMREVAGDSVAGEDGQDRGGGRIASQRRNASRIQTNRFPDELLGNQLP